MYCWASAEHLDATNTLFDEEKKYWTTHCGSELDLSFPW
jgi:hypothetical protein